MENLVKDSNFVLLDELKQNTLEEIYDKVVTLNQSGKMSKDDLDTITGALVTLNQVFLKQEKANFIVRQATLADVDSLMEMIEYWAKQGQNLPRKRNDIIRGIQTFAVCVKDEQVVGLYISVSFAVSYTGLLLPSF